MKYSRILILIHQLIDHFGETLWRAVDHVSVEPWCLAQSDETSRFIMISPNIRHRNHFTDIRHHFVFLSDGRLPQHAVISLFTFSQIFLSIKYIVC